MRLSAIVFVAGFAAAGCGDKIDPVALDFVFKADVNNDLTFTYGGASVAVFVTDTDVRVLDTNRTVVLLLPIVEAVDFSPHSGTDPATCLDISSNTSPPYGRQAVLLSSDANEAGLANSAGPGLPKRSVTVCHSPL